MTVQNNEQFERFEDTKVLIKSRESERGQTIHWPKEEKGQTIHWPKEEKGQTIHWPKEEKRNIQTMVQEK